MCPISVTISGENIDGKASVPHGHLRITTFRRIRIRFGELRVYNAAANMFYMTHNVEY